MPSRRAEVTYIGKTESRKDNEAEEQIFRIIAICCFLLSVVLDSVAPATTSPDQHGLQHVLTTSLLHWQHPLHLQSVCMHTCTYINRYKAFPAHPFKNPSGLQVLFWDLPTSRLQKHRRTRRNTASGASSWKSSSSTQGWNLSRTRQKTPSMKKKMWVKMKYVNRFHFHTLLSCSEFWKTP